MIRACVIGWPVAHSRSPLIPGHWLRKYGTAGSYTKIPVRPEEVVSFLRTMAEQGLAVVIISHNLHDIFEVADRITCLRLGRNVAVFDRESVTQQEVVHAITAGIPTKVAGIPGTGEEI